MFTRTCLAFVIALAAAWGADPLSDLRFADGKARSLEQFHGQTVVLINLCSH